uniref:Uncharacterized protein n=1 Tax=Astyanax mexicanus TaxID=7994 RepID=A0A8B9RMG3_ASTMX
PYEYHLAGYGDELPITPPRKHKLSHSFEEQYLLGPKRPVIRHVLYNQYLHPTPSSLPNLFSVPRPIPSIPHLSPPFHTRIPVSYPPASSFETESFKDPLKFLRDLADEYKSQPLNLSNKKGSLETSRDTPSSFSPLSNKKRPQFLNAPLPIYTKGDQPAAAAAAAPPRMEPPAQAVVNPMSMDESHAMNLTSSSESSPTLKKPPTPTATPTAPIPHRQSYPSASSAFPNKHPEQNPHSTKAGPSEKPQPSSSQAPSRPTLDSYGGMEIQIPLYLLQNWIKEGLISSLASTHHHPSGGPSNEPNKTPTPERLSRARMASESSEGPTSGSKVFLAEMSIRIDHETANKPVYKPVKQTVTWPRPLHCRKNSSTTRNH